MNDQVKLNLGCGPTAVPGWVNIDRSPNTVLDRLGPAKRALGTVGLLSREHMATWSRDIVRADIRKLPYPNGSAVAIYSSHTLEHLYFRDAQRVVAECFRVLQPGGVLRLALPDAYAMAMAFTAGCDQGRVDAAVHYHSQLNAHPLERPSGLARLRLAAGGHIHRWQPAPVLVESMLTEAGFQTMERADFRNGRCPDLERIETRPESFFIEAIR